MELIVLSSVKYVGIRSCGLVGGIQIKYKGRKGAPCGTPYYFVVDFAANFCGKCKAMEVGFEEKEVGGS